MMCGILYWPVAILVAHHAHGVGRVHRRVPRHVRHVEEQRVDRIRIAGPGVVDHHVHQAVHGERRFPAECLVDAMRRAVDVEQQILGRGREAERQAVQRMHRPDLRGRLGGRRRGLRERRLVAEAAGAIDRAQQHLQQMDGAAGLEAVGMRADAAHRVHGDRAADDLVVIAAGPIDPADRDLDRVVERGLRQLRRDAPDGRGRNAALLRHLLRRVALVEIARRHQLEHRTRLAAIAERDLADQARRNVRAPARCERRRPCRRTAGCRRCRARTGRGPRSPAHPPPATARWCSAPGNRDRCGRPSAAHARSPARTGRRCRA